MAIIPLTLPTGSNVGRSGQVANARLINAYVDENGDGKAPYVIYAAPGLTRWDNDSYAGASRGLIELTSNALIHFTGNQVVSYDQGAGDTLLGTLVGAGRVHLARNRRTTPQIGIVTSAGQYYILESGVITQVTDADLPTPNSIAYSKGVFILGIEDGRIYATDVEDGANIQGDSFGVARSDSSDLVRVVENAGFLYVFKAKGIEIWQADPSLAAENFFFSPVQQNIDIGCSAPHSIVPVARGLAWVDDDGIVRLGRDGGAQRISNHTVERDIAALTNAQRQAIEGFTYTFHGHEVYKISSPLWTHQYDVTVGKWNERKTYEALRWQASSCVQFNGRYVTGNVNDGKLFLIDPDTHDEDGANLVSEIWCAHSHRFPGDLLVDAFYLDIASGVGITSLNDNAADPKVMIDYSDDGGVNFEGERVGELGRVGERKRRLRLNKWGKCSESGRIWRIRSSAPVLRGTIQAWLDARPAA